MRITAVGVAFADAAILAMDQHLAALTHGRFTRGCNDLALGAVDGRLTLVTCSLHRPATVMRNNILICLYIFTLHVLISVAIQQPGVYIYHELSCLSSGEPRRR